MKKLALAGLAAFGIGAAGFATAAAAVTTAPGASAHTDMLVQVKHKKHSKQHKKSKTMDENKDMSAPSSGSPDAGKGM
jgi:Spy/CpxP family protein refolding chaperone